MMMLRRSATVAKDVKVLKNLQKVLLQVKTGCIPKELQIQSTWSDSKADQWAIEMEAYVHRIDELIEKNVPDKTVFTTLLHDEEQRAIDGVRLLLLKFHCLAMKKHFHPNIQMERVLQTYWTGDMKDLLHQQFQLFDTDNDGKISQSECVEMFHHLFDVYKACLEELVTKHCEGMTKKHVTQLHKSFVETQWNEKVFEKVRCSFHFALQDKDEKTLPFNRLYASQQKEFPALNQLLVKYMDGFAQTRQTFYDTRNERRKTLAIGTVFTIAVGLCDYLIHMW